MQASSTPYLNQFDVIPKSKMTSRQKETIIDQHLKELHPSRKELVKGTKITPDHYGPNTGKSRSHPKARDVIHKSRRRNSHGNRAFNLKHKQENEAKAKEIMDFKAQGFLQLTNADGENILFDINKALKAVQAKEIRCDDEVILRAVIFDQEKGQPLDTDYFIGNVKAKEHDEVTIELREDFAAKFRFGENREEIENSIVDHKGEMAVA